MFLLAISFKEHHVLFELLITFSFLYAGFESFSKAISAYIYVNINYKQIKEDLDFLSGKLLGYKAYFETLSKDEKEKKDEEISTIDNMLKQIVNEQESISNLLSDDNELYKKKKEILENYNGNRFKALFLFSGFYFMFHFVVVIFYESVEINNPKVLFTWFLSINIFLIILYVLFAYYRFKRKRIRDFRIPFTNRKPLENFLHPKITFIVIIILFALFTLFTSFYTYSHCDIMEEYFLCIRDFSSSKLITTVNSCLCLDCTMKHANLQLWWLLSLLSVAVIPFIVEFYNLHTYMKYEIVSNYKNKFLQIYKFVDEKHEEIKNKINEIINTYKSFL